MFKSGLSWLWIAGCLVPVDYYTKRCALLHLVPYQSKAILPFFNLTLVFNKGAAFSFLHAAHAGQNVLFGCFAAVMSVVMLYWLSRLPFRAYGKNIALNFILTGAIGNVLDRIQYGYVIDFLDFHVGHWHFAIFNIADSAICIGAFLLLWRIRISME